jgi:hypothetical protein
MTVERPAVVSGGGRPMELVVTSPASRSKGVARAEVVGVPVDPEP